jgi:hypothetical protein
MPKLNWNMRKMEVSDGNGVERQRWEDFQGTRKRRKKTTVQVPQFDTFGSLILASHQY